MGWADQAGLWLIGRRICRSIAGGGARGTAPPGSRAAKLEMSFFVGKHGVCECCNERGLAVVTAVAETEEGGEEAGDDEDG